jgi:hypothetical protein
LNTLGGVAADGCSRDLRHYAESAFACTIVNGGARSMASDTIPSKPNVPRACLEWAGRRLSSVVEGIEGALLLFVTILGAPLLRHAFNHWGTTKGEGRATMRADGDLVLLDLGLLALPCASAGGSG